MAILSRFTDFFAKALSPNSGFTEASTKTVHFPEHSPESIKAFVEFCYTSEYSCAGPCRPHLEVYFLADYLIVPELKELAVEKLRGHVDLPAGDQDQATFKAFWEKELRGVVELVYANTTSAETHRDIRAYVLDVVLHGLLVLEYPWEQLSEPMKSYNEFTAAAFTRYMDAVRKRDSDKKIVDVYGLKHSTYPTCIICPSCRKVHIEGTMTEFVCVQCGVKFKHFKLKP